MRSPLRVPRHIVRSMGLAVIFGACGQLGFEPIAPDSSVDGTLGDATLPDGVVPDGFVPDGFMPDGFMPDGPDSGPADAGPDARVCLDDETRVVGTCGVGDLGQSIETCAANMWGPAVCVEDPPAATHQGWVHVRAEGPRVPKATNNALPSAAPFVELTWNAMTVDPAQPITSYHVFRSETAGPPYDFLGRAEVAASRYRDDTVAPNTTYYYVVRPVVDVLPLVTSEADSEITVPVPPANMVLVHRWIANQDVCSLFGETGSVERERNYRCHYRGPGRINYAGDTGEPSGADAHFDLGAHYFVDYVETGCNFTLRSSGCPDAAGNPGVCLGTGGATPSDPANDKGGGLQVGTEGDVFYDRTAGRCYYHNTTGWVWSSSATPAERAALSLSAPGLPPLSEINQGESSAICEARMVGGTSMQLMSRKLQIAVSAWDATSPPAAIAATEAGAAPLDCNTDAGHPGDITFDDNVEPANYDTLPGTLSGSTRTLRTGALATSNCVSRYGAQDLVGNLWEWASDMCMSAGATSSCTGIASTLDPSNHDLQDVVLTEAMGGGGDAWDLSAAEQCLPALGLPAAATAPAWYDAKPTASVDFHGDRIHMYSNNDTVRGTYVGGSESAGATGGRYAINFSETPSYRHARIGFRCAVRIP